MVLFACPKSRLPFILKTPEVATPPVPCKLTIEEGLPDAPIDVLPPTVTEPPLPIVNLVELAIAFAELLSSDKLPLMISA